MRRKQLLRLAVIAVAVAVTATLVVSGATADPPTAAPSQPASVPVVPPLLPTPTPSPQPSPEPAVALDPDVEVEIDGFLAWAALDRTEDRAVASRNAHKTNSTESMIKVWLVADYLRRTAEAGKNPSKKQLSDARRAIRYSDDAAAERLYQAGGTNKVVERMIKLCELEDTEIYPYWWSRTQISALDAVRLGTCIADGTAAGPEWTDWVLTEMRQVRGSTAPADQPMTDGGEGGWWGIVDGLPPATLDRGVAIKNGWTRIGATGSWHLNCLAITDDWVLAVLMRYPAELDLDYGADRCAAVADQVIVADPADPTNPTNPQPADLP